MQITTTLLKTFNTTLDELGAELALIALKEDGFGPFQPQAHRGFSPREVQVIARALSHPEVRFDAPAGSGAFDSKTVRIRMTAPAHRSLMGIPLSYGQGVCGALVIGRKDVASFSEKDRRKLVGAAGEIESALAKAGLIATAASPHVRAPALAAQAPVPTGGPEEPAIESLMAELGALIPYDRALLTWYEAPTKTLAIFLSYAPGRCEWQQGPTLAIDGSAAGWVIRHKKPRLDRDLASSQGRFLDHKQLYKEKLKAALVLPLRKGPDMIGTIALASRTPDLYHPDMARASTALLDRLAATLLTMRRSGGIAPTESVRTPSSAKTPAAPDVPTGAQESLEAREVLLRHERQAAIRELTGFLEEEIQQPLTKSRLELEEALEEPALEVANAGVAQRVKQACRDLTQIEARLNEILDHVKPLDLRPRVVQVPEVIESALAVIAGQLEQRHITVTRQFAERLPPIKADEGKLQQAFLSILKNALEAMTPEGHIHLEAAPSRGARGRYEVAMTIQNDGAPIPTAYIGKIFEPGFTTKAAGTGLGLSSVKKIIEEHHGQISIASGPGQGTTVIIRLPAHAVARRRSRGRRRPRQP